MLATRAIRCVAGTLIGVAIAAGTADASGESSAGEARVIASFASGPADGPRYEVAVACTDGECPISVRLTQDGRVIDSDPLDWPADGADVSAVEAGAGDPLAEEPSPAWLIGSDEGGISLVARTVRRSAGNSGLLIDQEAGFEHVKRQHYLFAVVAGKLRRAWVGGEGSGPTWSMVAIVPGTAPDSQDIVVYDGVLGDGTNEPDRLEITRLAWDGDGATLRPAPAQGLHAVVVGKFADAEGARQARLDAGGCLDGFAVLRESSVGAAADGGVVLAALTAQPMLAAAAVERIGDCLPAGFPDAPRLSFIED